MKDKLINALGVVVVLFALIVTGTADRQEAERRAANSETTNSMIATR